MDEPHPLAAEPPPYLLTRPACRTTPLVFASPHSGRFYPPDFVAAARLDPIASVIQRLVSVVRANPKKIAFAEGEEEPIIRAAIAQAAG